MYIKVNVKNIYCNIAFNSKKLEKISIYEIPKLIFLNEVYLYILRRQNLKCILHEKRAVIDERKYKKL